MSFVLIGLTFLLMSALVSLTAIMSLRGLEYALEWEVMSAGGAKVVILIVLDFIGLLFLGAVLVVSGSVFIYSRRYMREDKLAGRFALLVLSFVVSMGLLILRPNLVSLLLGWDGLGVTSYLLVCYYSREKRFNASMLTALTNRIGDVFILLSISVGSGARLYNYGILGASNVAEGACALSLIILAAITKRAQIPFSA